VPSTPIGQVSAGIQVPTGSAPAGVLGKQTQPPVIVWPLPDRGPGQPFLMDKLTEAFSRVPWPPFALGLAGPAS
jgi:hypothetical protein